MPTKSREGFADLFLAAGASAEAPAQVRRYVDAVAASVGGARNPLRYHALVYRARQSTCAALFQALVPFSTVQRDPPRRPLLTAAAELQRMEDDFDRAVAFLTSLTGRPDTGERLREDFRSADPVAQCAASAVLAILLALVTA